MKIKDQVTSLVLSKKLKRLGVKQESLWYWRKLMYEEWELADVKPTLYEEKFICSAFTVAELGKLLPHFIKSVIPREQLYKKMGERFKEEYRDIADEYRLTFWGDPDGWKKCSLDDIDTEFPVKCFNSRKEAKARAKMLIYLKENKLI